MKEKSQIRSDWYELTKDGQAEAQNYFIDAINKIDEKFGVGFSKEHPELIGAFMKTASISTLGTVIGKCILELRDSIDEHKNTIWDSANHIAERIS